MVRDHPITGVGFADFEALLHRYAPALHETHTHPHDLFLNLWLNLGVLGLVAFVAVLAILVATIVQELRRGRGTEFYFLFCGVAAALAGVLTHGLVDNAIWKNDLALQFWTLAALVTAAQSWHAIGQPPLPGDRIQDP
jgi:O-antigen ligase